VIKKVKWNEQLSWARIYSHLFFSSNSVTVWVPCLSKKIVEAITIFCADADYV
jgi:hypothetical protein